MLDNLPQQQVKITDTRQSHYSPFWKTRVRFFAQDDDPVNPEYCYSTLFETKFFVPIRPVSSYRVKKRDRNRQTWYAWEYSGTWDPKQKILTAEKVELRQDQIRWVKFVYWYLPGAAIAIGLVGQLLQIIGHSFYGAFIAP